MVIEMHDRDSGAEKLLFVFGRNAADITQIGRLLTDCDPYFSPSLSSRVNINLYSEKIVKSAERFEAWLDGCLIGLVAVYCNRLDGPAFVTNVCVRADWKGRGIASALLRGCVNYLCGLGFSDVYLDVGKNNGSARKLYKKIGFLIQGSSGDMVRMGLCLRK